MPARLLNVVEEHTDRTFPTSLHAPDTPVASLASQLFEGSGVIGSSSSSFSASTSSASAGLGAGVVLVDGGAVGLGHPLAATGTRLVLTLAHELKRCGGKFGVATACIGGGQGIAMIIESI